MGCFYLSFSSYLRVDPWGFLWRGVLQKNKWSFFYSETVQICKWCLWCWEAYFLRYVRSLTYHRRVVSTNPPQLWWPHKQDDKDEVRLFQKWWVLVKKQSKKVSGFCIALSILHSSWTLWVVAEKHFSRTKIYLKL